MSAPAQVLAANLLAQLAANGVDHVFLAPGARSQALAVAAGQLAEAGHIQLHVRLDERSLGFQALGVGLASGFPAAVITTSGTAVANLHPAVLEAHHSGIPMILLTADRPSELRGVGANQTTNQVGIFADAVVDCIDVPAPAETDTHADLDARAESLAECVIVGSISQGGPVQVNLGFREPLSSVEPNAARIFDTLIAEQLEADSNAVTTPGDDIGDACTDPNCGGNHGHSSLERTVIDLSLKTVVIAGDGGYLAQWYSTGIPLFAEPSSGVRHLPESVPGYLFALKERPDLVQQVQQVLVFGKPTLSRPIQALIKRPGVRVFSDPGRHGVFNPGHNAHVLGDDVEFLGDSDEAWLEQWKATAKELSKAAVPASVPGRVNRRELVAAVYSAAGKLNPIVLGASRLIREADHWAPAKERKVYANRGLAGIDGTIATATGIALTHPGSTVRVLLGDLTFLHDAGSLAIDAHDTHFNLQVVVGNDNGGTIFQGLEVAKTVPDAEFTRLFRTPQKVDFALLARAYGWQYVLATSQDDLKAALKLKGRVVIEVPLEG